MAFRISSEHRIYFQDLLSKYDLNGDGTVPLEELSKALRETIDPNLTDDEIEKTFKINDINNDGIIVLEDLIRMFEKKMEELGVDPNLLKGAEYSARL